jgi:CubicO group peptidase (beta-lactamase class C family)
MMTAAEIMSDRVVTIRSSATFAEAVELMKDKSISTLLNLGILMNSLLRFLRSLLRRYPVSFHASTSGYDLPKIDWEQNDLDEIVKILKKARGRDAVTINYGQKTLLSWGSDTTPIGTHSVRKSIISALLGIAIEKGNLSLQDTVEDWQIEEPNTPLTEIEKKATVADLLMARSGVYIESGAETPKMKERRPQRGQYKPGEHWYYNNWDFNVLGTIFEKATQIKISDALAEWIAKPTGMQDFQPSHVTYRDSGTISQIPVYRIYMSSRDLARFGSLYLNNGWWQDKQIIPEDWIKESTKLKTDFAERTDRDRRKNFLLHGYAYLWWNDRRDENTYWAIGLGGQQSLLVDRTNNLTIAARSDTSSCLHQKANIYDVLKIHEILTRRLSA